ncbi:AraC family transcriptional regulator [Clostridioides difficile]|nr:AraC family transcriptional regulator [Clostridioides difficile]
MAKSEAIRYFQSVMNEITPFHRSLLLNRSWRTAAHAYAHHNHKEEVFDEWIFGCQGSLPFSPHKAKQVEGI